MFQLFSDLYKTRDLQKDKTLIYENIITNFIILYTDSSQIYLNSIKHNDKDNKVLIDSLLEKCNSIMKANLNSQNLSFYFQSIYAIKLDMLKFSSIFLQKYKDPNISLDFPETYILDNIENMKQINSILTFINSTTYVPEKYLIDLSTDLTNYAMKRIEIIENHKIISEYYILDNNYLEQYNKFLNVGNYPEYETLINLQDSCINMIQINNLSYQIDENHKSLLSLHAINNKYEKLHDNYINNNSSKHAIQLLQYQTYILKNQKIMHKSHQVISSCAASTEYTDLYHTYLNSPTLTTLKDLIDSQKNILNSIYEKLEKNHIIINENINCDNYRMLYIEYSNNSNLDLIPELLNFQKSLLNDITNQIQINHNLCNAYHDQKEYIDLFNNYVQQQSSISIQNLIRYQNDIINLLNLDQILKQIIFNHNVLVECAKSLDNKYLDLYYDNLIQPDSLQELIFMQNQIFQNVQNDIQKNHTFINPRENYDYLILYENFMSIQSSQKIQQIINLQTSIINAKIANNHLTLSQYNLDIEYTELYKSYSENNFNNTFEEVLNYQNNILSILNIINDNNLIIQLYPNIIPLEYKHLFCSFIENLSIENGENLITSQNDLLQTIHNHIKECQILIFANPSMINNNYVSLYANYLEEKSVTTITNIRNAQNDAIISIKNIINQNHQIFKLNLPELDVEYLTLYETYRKNESITNTLHISNYQNTILQKTYFEILQNHYSLSLLNDSLDNDYKKLYKDVFITRDLTKALNLKTTQVAKIKDGIDRNHIIISTTDSCSNYSDLFKIYQKNSSHNTILELVEIQKDIITNIKNDQEKILLLANQIEKNHIHMTNQAEQNMEYIKIYNNYIKEKSYNNIKLLLITQHNILSNIVNEQHEILSTHSLQTAYMLLYKTYAVNKVFQNIINMLEIQNNIFIKHVEENPNKMLILIKKKHLLIKNKKIQHKEYENYYKENLKLKKNLKEIYDLQNHLLSIASSHSDITKLETKMKDYEKSYKTCITSGTLKQMKNFTILQTTLLLVLQNHKTLSCNIEIVNTNYITEYQHALTTASLNLYQKVLNLQQPLLNAPSNVENLEKSIDDQFKEFGE